MKNKAFLLQEELFTPGSHSDDQSCSLPLESNGACWKVSSLAFLLHLVKYTNFACLVEIQAIFVIKAAKACN